MAEFKASNNNRNYAQQVKLSSSADDNEMRSQVRVPILLPTNHKNQGVYCETPSIYGEQGSHHPASLPRPSLSYSRELEKNRPENVAPLSYHNPFVVNNPFIKL